MNQQDCFACRTITGTALAPGGVLYENEHWLADHCVGPFGVGTIVVKTKAHREALWELTTEEAATLGPTLKMISRAIVEALNAERVYLSMWVDAPPYHVHLLLQPRYPGRFPSLKAEVFGARGLNLQLARVLRGGPDSKAAEEAARKIRLYLS